MLEDHARKVSLYASTKEDHARKVSLYASTKEDHARKNARGPRSKI